MHGLVMGRSTMIGKFTNKSGFEITFVTVIAHIVMLHVDVSSKKTNFCCLVLTAVTFIGCSDFLLDLRLHDLVLFKYRLHLCRFLKVGSVVLPDVKESLCPEVAFVTIQPY